MKRHSKIVIVIVFILAMSIFLTACSPTLRQNRIDGGNPNATVYGNGSLAVQQGNYIYFVNGMADLADLTRDNTFRSNRTRRFRNDAQPTRGAIVRGSIGSDGSIAPNSLITIVPQAFFTANTDAGIYIFGEWIYWITPNNAMARDGRILTDQTLLRRTTINGLNTTTIATIDGAGFPYTVTPDAFIYFLNGELRTIELDGRFREHIIASDLAAADVLFPAAPYYIPGTNAQGVRHHNVLFDYVLYARTQDEEVTGAPITRLFASRGQIIVEGRTSRANYHTLIDSLEFVPGRPNLDDLNADQLYGYVHDNGEIIPRDPTIPAGQMPAGTTRVVDLLRSFTLSQAHFQNINGSYSLAVYMTKTRSFTHDAQNRSLGLFAVDFGGVDSFEYNADRVWQIHSATLNNFHTLGFANDVGGAVQHNGVLNFDATAMDFMAGRNAEDVQAAIRAGRDAAAQDPAPDPLPALQLRDVLPRAVRLHSVSGRVLDILDNPRGQQGVMGIYFMDGSTLRYVEVDIEAQRALQSYDNRNGEAVDRIFAGVDADDDFYVTLYDHDSFRPLFLQRTVLSAGINVTWIPPTIIAGGGMRHFYFINSDSFNYLYRFNLGAVVPPTGVEEVTAANNQLAIHAMPPHISGLTEAQTEARTQRIALFTLDDREAYCALKDDECDWCK